MRVIDVGRQSMDDTFGDKRALFLKALELYVTESVHSIVAEVAKAWLGRCRRAKRPGNFRSTERLVQCGRLHGAQRISEFGRQDADVTRISRDAARVLRPALRHVLTRAKNQREISSDAVWIAWQTSLRARSLGSGSRPKRARVAAHFAIWQPLRQERTSHRIAEQLSVRSERRRVAADAGPMQIQLCIWRIERFSGYLHQDFRDGSAVGATELEQVSSEEI